MISEGQEREGIDDGKQPESGRMTKQEYRHSIHRRISILQSMTKSEPLYQHLGSLAETFNYIVSEGLAAIPFEQGLEEIENIMRSDKTEADKLSEIKKVQFLEI
jgi:hypothetical protein